MDQILRTASYGLMAWQTTDDPTYPYMTLWGTALGSFGKAFPEFDCGVCVPN